MKCIWLLSSLVFFAAGVAKLRFSGLAWVTSDNLATMLLQHHYKSDPIVDWGKTIAGHALLCKILAAGTIAVEIGFPLAMFHRWLRWLFVSGMFFMQIGIALLMGVVFTQFMFVYLFWIPWDRIGRFAQRVLSPWIDRRFVLYDGGCGVCRRTVTILHHLDVLRRNQPLDIVHDWPSVAARFAERIDRDACLIEMHVVTERRGRVDTGYDAYRSIAWTLPAAWILLPLLYLPPVRWLGQRIYRHVAMHRHDAGCEIQETAAGSLASSIQREPLP